MYTQSTRKLTRSVRFRIVFGRHFWNTHREREIVRVRLPFGFRGYVEIISCSDRSMLRREGKYTCEIYIYIHIYKDIYNCTIDKIHFYLTWSSSEFESI